MKALVYNGSRDVSVKEVPDARIERPTDVLVRITATNICGSDLHMREGRTDLKPGKVLGHENLGMVAEVGDGVERVKVGDHVCLPFNIGCGFCRNCETGMPSYCLTANPDPEMAGAAYGFAGMGPFSGGQAEYLRVPFGDFNCLRLPEDAAEKEDDYVMVADIFPTGWHATRLAGLKPGESCVVYGAGPVGLMAAYSALLQGASQVMVVDRHPDRLRLVERMGAIPVDDSKGDPVEQILNLTDGLRADCGCECVGYTECHSSVKAPDPGAPSVEEWRGAPARGAAPAKHQPRERTGAAWAVPSSPNSPLGPRHDCPGSSRTCTRRSPTGSRCTGRGIRSPPRTCAAPWSATCGS